MQKKVIIIENGVLATMSLRDLRDSYVFIFICNVYIVIMCIFIHRRIYNITYNDKLTNNTNN